MVCENENRKSRAVLAYMIGMTSGGIISGYISDKLVFNLFCCENLLLFLLNISKIIYR